MSELILQSHLNTLDRLDGLPAITVVLFHRNGWMLFYAFPWAVYSLVLTLRRELTPNATFLFAGTAVFGATLLLCAFFVAAVLPFLRLHA